MFLTGKVALGFHPDGGGLQMGVTNCISSVTWECSQLSTLLGAIWDNNTGYALGIFSAKDLLLCGYLWTTPKKKHVISLSALRQDLQKIRETVTIQTCKYWNTNKAFRNLGLIDQDYIVSSSYMMVKKI